MSDAIKEISSEIRDAGKELKSLEFERDNLVGRIESIREEIQALNGSLDDSIDQRDELAYEDGKKRYKDVSLADLIIQGHAQTRIVYNDMFEFTIRNLSKGESLDLDRSVKAIMNEPKVYVENYIRILILSKALVSFGVPGDAVITPDAQDDAIEAIKGINDAIFNKIWMEYIQFTSWIHAGLKTQLKNF